ncbi:hypothetical protein HMPREF1141_3223 [Clostridium sp. MSTE9]|nr:hypothetical protein HMPREF1141_3223 [Clostridium sp. MSTE9]
MTTFRNRKAPCRSFGGRFFYETGEPPVREKPDFFWRL